MAGCGAVDRPTYNRAMTFAVRAVTLDLDDTLWPFAPIAARIERVIHDWMLTHSPRTAEHFPIVAMRALREQVAGEHPHLAYDMGEIRRLTLQRALVDSGGDGTLADAAYAAFYAERNRVECYPDSVDALARIAARVPIAAVTNGNADLERIGLSDYFRFSLAPREHGAAKPEASIFLAACDRLDVPAAQVLHVGDHAEADVIGAARAGLRTCWINRDDNAHRGHDWPTDAPRPDLEFDTLAALADWLDAHAAIADRTATA